MRLWHISHLKLAMRNRFVSRHSFSLRGKLLFSCISCLSLALVVQMLWFRASSSRIIMQQTQEFSLAALKNLQDDIYEFCRSVQGDLIKIYLQKDLLNDMAFVSDAAKLRQAYGAVAYDMVLSQFDTGQPVVALYLYRLLSEGRQELLSSYHHAKTPVYSYPDDVFSGEMANNTEVIFRYIASPERTMLVTSYFNTKRHTDIIRFVLKLYRNVSEQVGFLVCDVDSKALEHIVEKELHSEGELIWLQPTGDRAAFMRGDVGLPLRRTAEQLMQQLEQGAAAEDWEGNLSNAMLFIGENRKYNFTAYSLIVLSALRKNERDLTKNVVVSFIFLALIFSLCFLLISRSFTYPLIYMVSTMQRIRNGEPELRLKQMKQDEIGVLASEFNEMMDRIEMLVAQQYQAILLANESRYKALQAQVNPHFLYNTLETMGGIAASKDCQEVGLLCRSLSKIFRYSLDMSSQFSTIREEVIHLKNYLYVMNARMQNTISLEIAIDGSLLEVAVPRLILQPVVENCIKHGFRNRHGQKLIDIYASVQGRDMSIFVKDNGEGFDAKGLNACLQAGGTDALCCKDSIGLMNIQGRMRMLYGAPYGLSIQSGPEGTCVIILLPLRQEENRHV